MVPLIQERERRAHRALSGSSRVRILQALRESDRPLDAFELAERVDLHHNTVRSHLAVLGSSGLVRRSSEASARPGRPRIVYRAAATHEGHYETLSRVLAEHLASGAGAEAVADAGRAWGRRSARGLRAETATEAVERLVELLDDLGFAPEAREGGPGEIWLHDCPFREVAREHPEIVCAVHLGLLRGALEELGGHVEATGLDPFVEPERCVAHLAPAGPGTEPEGSEP